MLERIKETNILDKTLPADKMQINQPIIIKATIMATLSTFGLLLFAISLGDKAMIGALVYLTAVNFLSLVGHWLIRIKTRFVVYLASMLYGVFLAVSPAVIGILYSIPLIIVDLVLFNWFFGRGERLRFFISGFLLVCAVTFFVFANFLDFPYHPNYQLFDFLILLVFSGFFLFLLLFYQREIVATEKAVLTNEQRYQALFENNPIGIAVIDATGRFTDSNTYLQQISGYSAEELLQLSIKDITVSTEIEKYSAAYGRLVMGEYREYNMRKNYIRKDGSIMKSHAFVKGIYDKNGKFLYAIGSILDNTKKIEAEEALKNSHSLLAATLESTADGILVVDQNREITQYNQKFLDLWRVPSYVIDQNNSPQLLALMSKHLKNPEAWLNKVEQLYQHSESISFDTFKLKDGRVIERYSQPQKINNKTVGRVWSFRDITQKHYAEQAVIESETKYRTLFEFGFDGILIYDLKQRKTIQGNQKVANYFGIKLDRFLKAQPYDFLPEIQPNGEKTKALIKSFVEEILKAGKTQQEWQLFRLDGTPLFSEVTAFQLPKPNTNLIVVIFKDITEKKKQEVIIKKQVSELNEKNIDLKRYIESNLQLENFAYIASHDLKAPMRTIVSFSQLLKRSAATKLDDTEKEFLDFIITAIYNMRSLVEDLLTYSRVNSQAHKNGPVAIQSLIEEVLFEMQTTISEKEAEIEIRTLPQIVQGDSTKMRQLFQNMIANAIKFNRPEERPKVVIGCEDRNSKWVFFVRDNGIGIEQEFHQKIFLLFRKLHNSLEYEGTGIGLALCKKIVEQHQGKIWLESEFGKGTTFYFSLPKSKVNSMVGF